MKTLFLLLLLIPQSLAIMKMIQFFGKVTYGPFSVKYPTPSKCASGCFDLNDCILSWKTSNGSCYHYSYLNRSDTIKVVETGKNDKSIVAFKTIITGTSCPISYTGMNFKMTIPTGNIYSWTKTGNSWSLNGCKDGWKRFDRNTGITVCMKAFNVPNLWRKDALTWCERENASFIGMASVEESQWVHELKYSNELTTGSAALNTTTNFYMGSDGTKDRLTYLAVATLNSFKPKTMYPASDSYTAAGIVCGYQLKN
ncbi:unnamed protein product [Caenorhabditis nigoni]